MFNEYYVVGQVQYSTTEGDFDVIAKFEYHEEAQKLVEAKQIAEDLERQAVGKDHYSKRFFVVTKV